MFPSCSSKVFSLAFVFSSSRFSSSESSSVFEVGGGGDENEDEDAKRLECALCSHIGRKQTTKDCIVLSCALCGFVCNAEFSNERGGG